MRAGNPAAGPCVSSTQAAQPPEVNARPARGPRVAPRPRLRVTGATRRHAFFPDKQQALDLCVEDVEALIASGRITADQGAILLGILSNACPQMA